MKTLKAFAKKPIAIVLAVLLVVGSISVIAMATNETGSATVITVFKGYDGAVLTPGTNAKDWKVQAGDIVTAEFRLLTDFPVGEVLLSFMFDNRILENAWDTYGGKNKAKRNIEYNDDIFADITDVDDASGTIDSLVDVGLLSAAAAQNLDGVYFSLYFEESYHSPVTYDGGADSWILRHNLKVKDANALRAYLSDPTTTYTFATVDLIPDSTKSATYGGTVNSYQTGNITNYNLPGTAKSSDMFDLTVNPDYNPAAYNYSEHLVFAGSITLDAIDGIGKFSDDNAPEVVLTETLSDISGAPLETSIDKGTDYEPKYDASAVDFIGWSTEKATGSQTDGNGKPVFGGDYTKMITADNGGYKDADGNPVIYNDSTLYAVYGAVDTTYTVKATFPDSTVKTSAAQPGYVGDTITIATEADIPNDIDVTGYEIDTANSDSSLGLVATASDNIYNITLKAKNFTIDWTVPGATAPEKSESIAFGSDKGVAAHSDPKVAYTDTSSDNYGKYVKWADHEGTLDVADDVHVTGTLENLPVKVVLHNSNKEGTLTGTFKTGDTTLDKTYGGSVAIGEFAEIDPPADYNITGYTWDTDNSGTSIPGTLDKDNYSFTAGTEDIPVLTTNIYPVFELKTGDVIFDANGGKFADESTTKSTNYTVNDTIVIPAAPTKDSEADEAGVTQPLEFLGWNDDQNATAAGTVPATFDGNTATYFAIWNDGRKEIKFLDKDENVKLTLKRNMSTENPYTITDEDKDAATAKITAPEGATWVWDAPDTATDTIEIRGHFEYQFRTVYTPPVGDSQVLADEVYKEGTPITAEADPSAADETFSGWYDNAECTGTVYAEPGASITMPANALTLYGKAVKNDYTITYKVDGEVYGEVETNNHGAEISKRALPAAKEGHSISDWTITEPTTMTEFPATMPMSNLVLEATNTPNTYTIVYVKPDGTLESTIAKAFGTDLSGETAPDVAAYNTAGSAVTYTGWSMEIPATMPVYSDTFEVDGTNYTDAVKVTPVSQANEKVKVTYIYADGTEAASLEDYPGATLSAPANTVEDGFDFAWDQTLTAFPNSDTTVNETKTPKDVNVIINYDDGTTTSSQTVPFDSTPTEPAAPTIPTGVDFEGWSTPDGIVIDFSKPLKDQLSGYVPEITLTPKFTVTDTYYAVDGTDADGNFTYKAAETHTHDLSKADETYTVPAGTDMEGFTFKFWSLDKENDAAPDGTYGATSRGFYPVYEINKHKVTYMSEGSVVQEYPDVAFASELPRPADPTREGYVFGGWEDADGKAPGDYASMPDKDLTFTAKWIIPGADYTITYYDREGKVYQTYIVHSGKEITDEYIPDDPQRFGFIFAGWEDEDGKSPSDYAVMPEENLEFNAVWELDPKFVALVVGGVVVSGAVVGGVAAANAAWITGAAIAGGVVIVGGIALAKHTHKVTYIVDGEIYKVFYILEGTKVIVPKDPTKDGAEFTGWTPEVPEKMPANDLTFEATWSTDASGDGDGDAAPVDDVIPDTGSATASLAAFAVISSAAAAAYVITRKKKEED